MLMITVANALKLQQWESELGLTSGNQGEHTTFVKMVGSGWCSAPDGAEWRQQVYDTATDPDHTSCDDKCRSLDNCIGFWMYVPPARYASTACTFLSNGGDFSGNGFSSTIYDRQNKGYAPGTDSFVLTPGNGQCECWKKTTTPMVKLPGDGWCAPEASGAKEFRQQAYIFQEGEMDCHEKCVSESTCVGFWHYRFPSQFARRECTMLSSGPDFSGSQFGTIWDRNSVGFAPGPESLVVSHIAANECWVKSLKAKASGDPHLQNLNGEKFNAHRHGLAPLVKIPADTSAHLRVVGLIEGIAPCKKTGYITAMNVSGSWLENTVAVHMGDHPETDEQAFYVQVDEQQVWSPAKSRNLPQWEGNIKDHKERRIVFNHKGGKFSILELDESLTSQHAPGVRIQLSSYPNLVIQIIRPMHRDITKPHFNFVISGLQSISHNFSVGGLLGTDDYSAWTKPSQECHKFARGASEENTESAEYIVGAASY